MAVPSATTAALCYYSHMHHEATIAAHEAAVKALMTQARRDQAVGAVVG